MGLRYDYGLDYWNYYEAFVNPANEISKEVLFWKFFYWFDKYYIYVLVKSLLLSFIMYYFVKKYVPVQYYAFFVFVFMLHSSLIYTMMTAERSCLGTMFLMICIEFFYLRKKRLLLLIGSIIIATMFHRTLFGALLIPIIDVIVSKNKRINAIVVTIIGLIVLIISSFVVSKLFIYFTNTIEIFGDYEYYYIETNRFKGSNIFGVIRKSLLLLPLYCLLININRQDKNSNYMKLIVLSLVYFLVYFLDIETDGRYGMLLIPFLLICMLIKAKMLSNKQYVVLMLCPFVLHTLWGTYDIYVRMINNPWLPGNYMTYKTIFEVGFFK